VSGRVVVLTGGVGGAAAAQVAPGVVEALRRADTRAVLIAPLNPFLSIDPILAVPGIRAALMNATAPVIAVAPIVGGKAVKAPTAKLMLELGIPVTPRAVADHYRGVIDGLLVDDGPQSVSIPVATADTPMVSLEDRARVASAALALADGMAS
jgi:LPPG:FO 2-phospho-L-lactate transferase